MEPRPSRPHLPSGYGIENATGPPGERPPWTRVSEWLIAARNYWVCTIRSDGRPHVKPVWGVWLDGAFIFSTHPETLTARNLRMNREVVVHLESGDQVVILEGTARRIHERSFLERFGRTYAGKYLWPMKREDVDPENPNAAFYSVAPWKVLTWETALEVGETITRWTFEGSEPSE